MSHNHAYALVDIGLVMNTLMGGAYWCSCTRRKFQAIYTTLMHKKAPVHHSGSFSSAALDRVYSSHLLGWRYSWTQSGIVENSLCPAVQRALDLVRLDQAAGYGEQAKLM